MDKQRAACFTGHRIISNADVPLLRQKLDETITELIQKDVVIYGVGMARGFDILAAQAVLRAREVNSDVKLVAILPCRNQEVRWNEADRNEYRRLLDAADKVVCLSESYFDGCMAARNLHLVQNSSVCVAYMLRSRSGSGQTVRLAYEHGLTVINLAEK